MVPLALDTDITKVELFPKFNYVLIGISILISAIWFVFYQKYLSDYSTISDKKIVIQLTSVLAEQETLTKTPVPPQPDSHSETKSLSETDKNVLSETNKNVLSEKEPSIEPAAETNKSNAKTNPLKDSTYQIDNSSGYGKGNIFNPALRNAIERAKARSKKSTPSKPLNDERQFEAAQQSTSYKAKNGCTFRSFDLGGEQRFFISGCEKPDEIKLDYHDDGPKYPSFER